MNLACYTNITECLPDRFRFRNMQVNLLQYIEDHEDYLINRPHPPSDSDDNSGNQEFPSGSFADSDQFFLGEENFDPQSHAAQESVESDSQFLTSSHLGMFKRKLI